MPPTVVTQAVVTEAELVAQHAAMLPARQTLCSFGCVNITNIVGVNIAIAVNAATVNSYAGAVAQQYLSSWQHR